jgi:hypothetical protein
MLLRLGDLTPSTQALRGEGECPATQAAIPRAGFARSPLFCVCDTTPEIRFPEKDRWSLSVTSKMADYAADYQERYLKPLGRQLAVTEIERIAIAQVTG